MKWIRRTELRKPRTMAVAERQSTTTSVRQLECDQQYRVSPHYQPPCQANWKIDIQPYVLVFPTLTSVFMQYFDIDGRLI